ncbi:phage antirepressor protein [Streptococcus pneumoniae]|nr:phage antirepressor protein [Streptococcus pneumoniae]
MNELINVTLNDNQEPVVSGRQLHEALGVNSRYTTWFDRMKEYGFTEVRTFSQIWEKYRRATSY